jgi:hypothetical protein
MTDILMDSLIKKRLENYPPGSRNSDEARNYLGSREESLALAWKTVRIKLETQHFRLRERLQRGDWSTSYARLGSLEYGGWILDRFEGESDRLALGARVG